MNVIVDVRGMNVNMRVGDKSAEGLLYVLSAKGAQFNASLGQRPRIHGTKECSSAESAIHFRVIPFHYCMLCLNR